MINSCYLTSAVGDNPFLKLQYNLSQGFGEYDFYPRSLGRSYGLQILKEFFPDRYLSQATTSDITRKASQWIQKNADNDFFLLVYYYDPHLPYSPPAEYLPSGSTASPRIGTKFSNLRDIRTGKFVPSLPEREWIRKLYASEVQYVDENIGLLLDTLTQSDIYDDSLIILTSDHGEEFWEHDGFEHGHTVYNELLSVPLIVKLPKSQLQTRISTPVSTQSLTPTVLDLCRIDPAPKERVSPSLRPLWEPQNQHHQINPIISTGPLYYENRISIIHEGQKYIRNLVTGREEYYNLDLDPAEQQPLQPAPPALIQKFRAVLSAHLTEAAQLRKNLKLTSQDKVRLTKELEEELRSLGYIK